MASLEIPDKAVEQLCCPDSFGQNAVFTGAQGELGVLVHTPCPSPTL